ncbi:MAG: GIY-YIG nuclease family protein [Patescibacteria group bacterium]|nr:GIY-YIG nuclease family protein [Patescibacteria group bacterium]
MRKIVINWNGVIVYKEGDSHKVPSKSGVYEILVRNKHTGKYMRKYIGSTDDLNRRFSEHLSLEEENDKIRNGVRKYVCGFDYALIGDEDDYLDAEQGLYDKHEYSWNKGRPEGSENDNYVIEER